MQRRRDPVRHRSSGKGRGFADEEFRTVDDKKIQDLKNTLAGEFSGPEYEPIKATGENTHDLSKLLDTSGRFSKACPVIPDVSFPWFGSTQTVSLSSVSSDLARSFSGSGILVAFRPARRG
ncbi:hypothetical protein ACIRUG_17845 [Pseudomonas aeruginosa]